MREQIQKPESPSRTIQSKTNASNQTSIAEVLQTYKKGIYQRQSTDEEELLQGKFETAQREAFDEEEEPLQGKFEVAQREENSQFSTLNSPLKNNTGLPHNLKSGIENLSGYSMDDVRVHYNSSKPAQLQALAYTQGTDIHVAPGQEQHLAHEAWHVVQQKQGRVQPTMQMQGVNVNDNEGLEREADVMGKCCVQAQCPNDDKKENSGKYKPLSSLIIQKYKGSIPPKGLSDKEIRLMIDQSETTMFDMRGHAKARHGSQISDNDQMERIISMSTSFDSNGLLFKTVKEVLKSCKNQINAWLESTTNDNLVLEIDMENILKDLHVPQLGSGMKRGLLPNGHVDKYAPAQKIDGLIKANVILRKSDIGNGKPKQVARDTVWHLLTAFPIE